MDNDSVDSRSMVDERCPTHIIEDAPAQADTLAANGGTGPHARVAHAIAELIRSGEVGGRMIGIEGGWGSGKTTVVNLLRKELEPSKNIHVFCFDAWAHEGDPLRRTYLESLISELKNIKWANAEQWTKTLDILSRRRKVVDTTTVPKPTVLGKWVALTAFFVPIGLLFLKRAMDSGLSVGLGLTISWNAVIGFFLASSPLLVILSSWLWHKARGMQFDLAFLEGRAITETRQETNEDPQPTSIEFENHFHNLMREALVEQKERVFVIVLDNLDRVNVKDALAIWSTLQTFLQYRGKENEEWFKRLSVVVPYDPNGLRQLWENRNEPVSHSGDQESDSVAEPTIVSDSFIDKSFQLRFEVPPLVLSNWKHYLTSLLAAALPKHKDEDQQLIYRVFNVGRNNDKPPTPRELKLYVNQIGAVHRQWQDTFPIGHVAYYASLRRMHRDVPDLLLKGKLSAHVLSLFPSEPDIHSSLAGLHFNVDATVGMQLLLTHPIKKALAQPDADELKRMESLYKDGFWVVLEFIAATEFRDSDAASIANVGSCLEGAEILKEDRREVRTIVSRLSERARHLTAWPVLEASSVEGISALCRIVSEESFSSSVVAHIRAWLKEQKDISTAAQELLIENLVGLCNSIAAVGHSDSLNDDQFVIPAPASDWIPLASLILRKDQRWRKVFTPNGGLDGIRKTLVDLVTNGQFLAAQLDVLKLAPSSFATRNWDLLALAIEQRLQADKPCTAREVDFLLHALCLIRLDGCSAADDALTRLTDTGLLMHWFDRVQADIASRAWCLTLFFMKRVDLSIPLPSIAYSISGQTNSRTQLQQDDPALAEQMLDVLRISGFSSSFLEAVEKHGYMPLTTRCLRLAVDRDDCETFFMPSVIARYWSTLQPQLNSSAQQDLFQILIRKLCADSKFVPTLEKSFQEFRYQDVGLYAAICKESPPRSFVLWCERGLQTLDATTWTSELQGYGEGLQMMLALKSTYPFTLQTSFQDAIVDFSRGIASGTVPSPELMSQWPQVLDALPKDSRAVLPRRLLAATPADGLCADAFFQMFGDDIAKERRAEQGKIVLARLLSPLVRGRKLAGLQWLKKLLIEDQRILDTFDSPNVDDFRRRLQEEIEKPLVEGDEADRLIRELADRLGIHWDQPTDTQPSEVSTG